MIAKQAMIKVEDIRPGWSNESVDFINRLLLRKIDMRLGSNSGAKDLMGHPWLKYYPWTELEKKTLLAPFIPENRDNFDKRYCECIDKITEETKYRYQEIAKTKEKLMKKIFNDYYFNKEDNIIKVKLDQRHNFEEEKHSNDNNNNTHLIKKIEMPFIDKIPLPNKSRQDYLNKSMNYNNVDWNIPNQNNNSIRDVNSSNSFFPKKREEMVLIRKKIDDRKHRNSTSLYSIINNSNSIKSYNDSFLNNLIHSNARTQRSSKKNVFNNQLSKTKMTLLKYHMRSSSVLNNKANNNNKSTLNPQINNIYQDQCHSSRNTQEFLYQHIKKINNYHNINKSKGDQKKFNRINSASKILDNSISSSTPNCMLNKTKYEAIYPSTKR